MKEKYTSATDINKYIYCNYSYYYEQTYGTKKLRQLKKEYNKEHGYEGKNKNFDRGNKFHDEYEISSKLTSTINTLIFIALVLFAIYYVYNLYF